MKTVLVFCIITILSYATFVDARVYRWTDKNGELVFSQTPPPENIEAEKIEIDAPPPATNDTAQKEAPLSEQAAKKVKGNPALDKKLRQEYCSKGKKNLEVLKSATPGMGFVTEDNMLIKLNAEDIKLKTQEAEAVIKAYCD